MYVAVPELSTASDCMPVSTLQCSLGSYLRVGNEAIICDLPATYDDATKSLTLVKPFPGTNKLTFAAPTNVTEFGRRTVVATYEMVSECKVAMGKTVVAGRALG